MSVWSRLRRLEDAVWKREWVYDNSEILSSSRAYDLRYLLSKKETAFDKLDYYDNKATKLEEKVEMLMKYLDVEIIHPDCRPKLVKRKPRSKRQKSAQ